MEKCHPLGRAQVRARQYVVFLPDQWLINLLQERNRDFVFLDKPD